MLKKIILLKPEQTETYFWDKAKRVLGAGDEPKQSTCKIKVFQNRSDSEALVQGMKRFHFTGEKGMFSSLRLHILAFPKKN